ncbi:MAG: GTP-binding protein, partial [Selenomonadaceae bacterium]|nr:GTP-binding protein [Selenomonadaceae bacterium]
MNEIKIVFVGHVDHGKSTVIGRLLFDTNSLPEGVVKKVQRIANETGKPFEYAYLLDAFEEEQQQGITIDTTQIQFSTAKRPYVIIDAPGHKEFLKNMISGAANANAAFLVIDARQGVQEQSKRHAYMLSLLGIGNVSVLVNKMDLVGFEQSTFDRIVADIKNFLRPLGVEPNKFIPVSGMLGDNITARSERMPWYEGETLIDALDLIDGSNELDQKFLRLPIQDVYKFDARRIIAGRIEAGAIAVGDRIKIYPEGRETTVKEIACWLERDRQQSARSGESTGICVVDEFFNKRGELITRADDQPPNVSDRFRASVFWMGRTPLTLNRKYKLKLATQEVEATVEQIVRTIDASNLESKSDATELKLNDVAELIIKLKQPIAFDVFSDCQATGRFVLVDGYDVAGGGIINAAEESSADERPSFIGENVTAHGELFDEFYYDVERQEITHVASPVKQSYRVGDEISTNGISYEYPGDFDVLFLREDAFISVRDKKITA